MAQSISASVGAGGVNRSDDTHTVQQLLNNVPAPRGGPSPKLDTDGKCGPITIGAIRRFQQLNTGFVDGRVDPGGQTIANPISEVLAVWPDLTLSV
jgi:peptidoglycan hydrolase-like protein with peptidoglycan-binding domain